jgi:hypothetical protein
MSSQETSRGDHMSTNRLSLRHFDKESPMIRTEIISPNSLRILVPEKLKADDFRHIAPQVDAIIGQYGKIRLLIDASQFNGWEWPDGYFVPAEVRLLHSRFLI